MLEKKESNFVTKKINIMKTLVTLTDFVISQIKTYSTVNDSFKKDLADIRNYALFLKQNLTLGMFVPCDEKGNVLTEPSIDFDGTNQIYQIKYERAKERVLFKEFSLVKNTYAISSVQFRLMREGTTQVYGEIQNNKFNIRFPKHNAEIIEDLINEYRPFELTESAIRQIGI